MLSPIARIQGPRNEGVEMGVALLIIALSDRLAKCLPHSPTTCALWALFLVPKGVIVQQVIYCATS